MRISMVSIAVIIVFRELISKGTSTRICTALQYMRTVHAREHNFHSFNMRFSIPSFFHYHIAQESVGTANTFCRSPLVFAGPTYALSPCVLSMGRDPRAAISADEADNAKWRRQAAGEWRRGSKDRHFIKVLPPVNNGPPNVMA